MRKKAEKGKEVAERWGGGGGAQEGERERRRTDGCNM